MPIKRDSVTIASKIMIPAYVLLTFGLGFVYLVDPLNNIDQDKPLVIPRTVMGGDMEPWGILFLVLSLVMCLTLWRGSRLALCFGLCACAVTFLLWSVLYVASCYTDPLAPATAPMYPAFVATACVASTYSLLRREV
jgi:hypothetical protein